MRKIDKIILLLFIFAVLAVLITASCEKVTSVKNCYVCTVETTWFKNGYYVKSVKEYPYCGVDTVWLNNFEKINTYSDPSENMVQICRCK